jgi:NAD(P)-dependent dehydrogenase (short-subunit alcohol dehydrogenase family)
MEEKHSDIGSSARTAIITGASRGIGKQIALRLARNGFNLVLAARTMDAGQSRWPGSLVQTAAEVRELGMRVTPIRCDVTRRGEVEALCQAALAEYGAIDVLVNNALYLGPGNYNPFLETALETWDYNMEANLMAAVVASRACLPSMLAKRRGVILNLTSAAATTSMATPGAIGIGAPYAVAKAALNGLVVALALETRPAGIGVFALDPGAVLTERADQEIRRHQRPDVIARQPMDIPAAAAEYLCCQCPLELSGQVLEARALVERFNLLPA